MPTIVQVITSLPTFVPKSSTHQPLDGGQFGDSPRGSSPKGDLLKKPPFNPHVGSFGGQHLTCTCSCHHGINHLLCNMFEN